jgi:general secretion pathway protein C
MGSVLTWTANGLLFVAACFLAAGTANQILVATLLSSSPEASAPAATAPPARSRTWADRQIILTRNLFNSSTLNPTPTEAVEDVVDLEKSQLPVTLLGTFAASDPELSRATLQDREKNETLVVGVGDQIKQKALVTRIERRRVVLTENGAPRELTLDDESIGTPSVVRRVAARPTRAARPVRRRADTDVSLTREQIRDTIRDPSDLLSQARVLPKFEDGEMVGLQVSGIKPGSLFESIGMQEGDVITEFNGIPISSPEDSARALQELGTAEVLDISGEGADGTRFTRSRAVND